MNPDELAQTDGMTTKENNAGNEDRRVYFPGAVEVSLSDRVVPSTPPHSQNQQRNYLRRSTTGYQPCDSSVDSCWSTVVAANTIQSAVSVTAAQAVPEAHQNTQQRFGHEAGNDVPCGVLPALVSNTSYPGVQASHAHPTIDGHATSGPVRSLPHPAVSIRPRANRRRRVGGSEPFLRWVVLVHVKRYLREF